MGLPIWIVLDTGDGFGRALMKETMVVDRPPARTAKKSSGKSAARQSIDTAPSLPMISASEAVGLHASALAEVDTFIRLKL
jgi:hypothetical protein